MENFRILRSVMTLAVMLLFTFSLLGCGGDDDSPVQNSGGSQSDIGSDQTQEETVVPTISVSKTDVEVSVDGGSFTITVTSNVDYTVSVDADWLTVALDTESSSLTITATANDSTESRDAVITIESGTLSVTVKLYSPAVAGTVQLHRRGDCKGEVRSRRFGVAAAKHFEDGLHGGRQLRERIVGGG